MKEYQDLEDIVKVLKRVEKSSDTVSGKLLYKMYYNRIKRYYFNDYGVSKRHREILVYYNRLYGGK